MPRQGSYVNNAMNRSLGRVGMAYGSAVHSSSSGGGYASSPRTYVDNSFNRQLGRVGMEHGTAVHSRSSGGSTCSPQSSSGYSTRTYVDNPLNRSLGRVGMIMGTAVHSSSGSDSYSYGSASHASAPKTYVDNPLNRSLGRVGMEHGTAVHSRSSGSSARVNQPSVQVENTYVDNAYNRRLGRVGLKKGTAVQSSGSTASSSAARRPVRTYVDNAFNRRENRVGLPLGSKPVSAASRSGSKQARGSVKIREIEDMIRNMIPERNFECQVTINTSNVYQMIDNVRQEAEAAGDEESIIRVEQMEGIVNRIEAGTDRKFQSQSRPSWLKSGDVINFNDLEIGEKIGGGGFGDVHVAIWKKEIRVCVKKLRVQRVSEARRIQFQNEVSNLSSLDHRAIVSFFGASVKTPNLAIVMEFLQNGSLHDSLHVEQRQFTDRIKYQFTSDLLSGLVYIHGKNMAHRDIKSMNVLITDELDHCKLSDFGLSLKEEYENDSSVADHSVVGTMKYSPKEVLDGERLTVSQFQAVDVYSLALTVIELMTESKPFEGLNQHQVRRALMNSENKDLDLVTPASLKSLLSKCVSRNPHDRPSASSFRSQFAQLVPSLLDDF